MSPQPLSVRFHSAMADIPSAAWNALAGDRFPHLSHEFLRIAEESGSVCEDTGWLPCHVTVQRGDDIVAAMPLYQKGHSWGEFVFDWSWADAYNRAGLAYYPKLVSVTPFTPATSSKLLVSGDEDAAVIRRTLVSSVLSFAREHDFSSLHLQFIDDADVAACDDAGLLLRRDCQFHWHNDGYRDFDHFLEAFSSKKRKNVRRERRRIVEAGIRHEIIAGRDIGERELTEAWQLCSRTFAVRGHSPYLNLEFFLMLREALPDALAIVLARNDEEQPLAAAMLLRGEDRLYGRYWGSRGEFHSLHFETCYYQGIEYCIREGIGLFEPGTQGEHKVSRGFLPAVTQSAHWLAHPQFAAAIGNYLEREAQGVAQYMRHIDARSPFKATGTD